MPSNGEWIYWVSGHEAFRRFISIDDLAAWYQGHDWKTDGTGAKSQVLLLKNTCVYTESGPTSGYYLCQRKYSYALTSQAVPYPPGWALLPVSPMPVAGPVGIYRQKLAANVLKCEYEVVNEVECVQQVDWEDAGDRVPENAANRDRLPSILPWVDQQGVNTKPETRESWICHHRSRGADTKPRIILTDRRQRRIGITF